MVLPYVYKLTHKITGQYYFGFRARNKVSSNQDLGIYYFTSSKYVKPIFNEFEIFIVAEFFQADDAWKFEQTLIREHLKDPLLLNKSVYKEGSLYFNTAGRPRTEDEKCRIRKSKKGKPNLGWKRESMERAWKARKGTSRSVESIQKQVKSRQGYTHSEETRRKIGNANRGKPSPRRGKKASKETLKRMRNAQLGHPGYWKGKKMPPRVDKL